jgi:predicted nucleotidyltransferase
MLPVLEKNRDAISGACHQLGVARLRVCGFALRDDFRPSQSDVGLDVEGEPMPP